MITSMPVNSLTELEHDRVWWDAGDHTYKLLGPQVGEAHRTGKLVLGCAILPWHQRDTGRDLHWGKISNAPKSQARCLKIVVTLRHRRMDYKFFSLNSIPQICLIPFLVLVWVPEMSFICFSNSSRLVRCYQLLLHSVVLCMLINTA